MNLRMRQRRYDKKMSEIKRDNKCNTKLSCEGESVEKGGIRRGWESSEGRRKGEEGEWEEGMTWHRGGRSRNDANILSPPPPCSCEVTGGKGKRGREREADEERLRKDEKSHN